MESGLIFDTDVLIDYLRGLPVAVRFLESRTEPLCISVISIAELFAGVRDEREKQAMKGFIEAFTVIDVGSGIAGQGGLLKQRYGKSSDIGLADALIGATALSTGARLVTCNRKHYPMVKDILTPYQK